MRVVVFGYQEVGYVCLEELIEQGAEVVGLVTHADAPGEQVWWHSAADLARRHQIPVFIPEQVNAPEFVATLRELRPDLIFSFYFRDLLSDEILAVPPHGGLNLHGSLLPYYRGRAPVNWVLVNGESETGVTLHYMVRRADAGDIVAQRAVPIAFEDTAATLYEKIVVAARETLRETWPLLREGRAPRTAQDVSQGSYCGRRRPEDGRIDWSWPALRCYNLIRAVTHPYPGAFTHLDGRKLLVWWATPISDFRTDSYPQISQIDADELTKSLSHLRQSAKSADKPFSEISGTISVTPEEVLVATGAGWLRLHRVQFEGEEEREVAGLAAEGRLRSGQRLD